MFQDDIELLVSQTFKEAQEIEGKSEFPWEATGDSFLEIPSDTPGLLYYLQKNSSTFVIRMIEAEDLRSMRERIISAPEDFPTLRLLSGEDERSLEEKLNFFECDNLQIAKSIKRQLANKRFPLHEERILNVSDPGDNWWIKHDQKSLNIYFKLCRTESIDTLTKVGPLGDCQEAMSWLNKLYGYFSLLFPVKDYSSAHGQFFMSCEHGNNPLFQEIVNVFTTGEIGNGLWERLREVESQAKEPVVIESLNKANYFLMEIASMRSFWIEIQDQL
ncbi:MAG: hypothetical protein CME64_09585 [Halobacteriovoraceae bacterium]|nr:hypothetical protein [Halobacteriovoraceae bacterium]|tara:strand:+ start:4066 stop:4887 length:822 start_codon:yes stop_codon:yes gene_type:complete